MAEFVCKLGTDAGRVLTQTEEARSEEELRQRLRAQGFLIFSIHPKDILSFQARSVASGKNPPGRILDFQPAISDAFQIRIAVAEITRPAGAPDPQR